MPQLYTTLYAIRHTITGNYLSAKWPGTSFWNGEPCNGPPKLFATVGSAKGWRTVWLKGPLRREYTTDFETGYIKEGSYTHEHDASRKAEHIEIRPVMLAFGSAL